MTPVQSPEQALADARELAEKTLDTVRRIRVARRARRVPRATTAK